MRSRLILRDRVFFFSSSFWFAKHTLAVNFDHSLLVFDILDAHFFFITNLYILILRWARSLISSKSLTTGLLTVNYSTLHWKFAVPHRLIVTTSPTLTLGYSPRRGKSVSSVPGALLLLLVITPREPAAASSPSLAKTTWPRPSHRVSSQQQPTISLSRSRTITLLLMLGHVPRTRVARAEG